MIKIKKRIFLFLCLFFLVFAESGLCRAEEKDGLAIENFLELEEFRLEKVEESLEGLDVKQEFSFQESVKQLIKGEIPLDGKQIKASMRDALFQEWKQQKEIAMQVLLLVAAAAVVLNFTDILDKNGTALVGFFLVYLMLTAVLLKSFSGMSQMTKNTLNHINGFMKALVPSYFAAAIFAGSSIAGVAFYESALVLISIVQWMEKYFFLPAVEIYVLFLLLNHLTKDDRLSKLAELVRTLIEYGLKTLLAATVGFQVVQGLILPAADGVKNTAWSRAASAIPGVGNLFGGITDTVLGSAVLLKNAVGVCGLIAIFLLCLAPICRMAFCVLLYKAMAAWIQPIGDKRLNECVGAVAQGAELLLKIMTAGSMMFFLTIAVVTASLGK